jgi:hypothetical protein
VPERAGLLRDIRPVLVASASGAVGGVLNASVLVLSVRHGHLSEIAGYTVVTSTLALVSVAVAGASTMLYVTGREMDRRAVRSQRVLFVFPALGLGMAGVCAFYPDRGYAWDALLLSGVVVIGNSLAELQYGDLARQMRFTAMAVVNCGSKVPAVVLAALGVPLTVALTLAVVVQFLLAEALLGRTSWLRRGGAGLSLREACSAFRLNRHLHLYGVAELYTARAASVWLSLVSGPVLVSHFGAVVSVCQGFANVLYAALQVPMADRVRRRLGLAGRPLTGPGAELWPVAGAITASIGVILAAPYLVTGLLRLPDTAAVHWLQLLALAMPFHILNRLGTTAAIGEGRYREANRGALLISALLTAGLLAGTVLLGPTGAAAATVFAELVAMVCLRITRRTA